MFIMQVVQNIFLKNVSYTATKYENSWLKASSKAANFIALFEWHIFRSAADFNTKLLSRGMRSPAGQSDVFFNTVMSTRLGSAQM